MNVEIVLALLSFWVLVLTVVLVWIFNYFRRLTREVNRGNLVKILEAVLEKEAKNSLTVSKLSKDLEKAREEGISYVQKLGLVRFNPFSEMGGDHSFSLALLDGRESGIILTGLHTRERTRVYIKKVKRGKSEYELSNEEKKALKSALSGK